MGRKLASTPLFGPRRRPRPAVTDSLVAEVPCDCQHHTIGLQDDSGVSASQKRTPRYETRLHGVCSGLSVVRLSRSLSRYGPSETVDFTVTRAMTRFAVAELLADARFTNRKVQWDGIGVAVIQLTFSPRFATLPAFHVARCISVSLSGFADGGTGREVCRWRGQHVTCEGFV